ncbi:MAG: hypothetical protein JWM60_857 [Solirubrobacterales bacterium]|nr:hypothetical protein [Solirubrobacterales bacterium]
MLKRRLNKQRYRVRIRSDRHIHLIASDVQRLLSDKLYEGDDQDLEVHVEDADLPFDLIMGAGLIFFGLVGVAILAWVVLLIAAVAA